MGRIVWIVNNYAGTPRRGMQFRQYYLAKFLRELGIEAYVISAGSHALLINPPEKKLLNKVLDEEGVPILWVNVGDCASKSKVKKFMGLFGFTYRFPYVSLKALPRPDVIIASSPHLFILPPAFKIAKKTGAKVIFEVRDIWPLSLVELLGMSKLHPLIVLMSYLEKMGYKKADAVVGLIPGLGEYLEEIGIKCKRLEYIPNGLPMDGMEVEPPPEDVLKKIEDFRGRYELLGVLSGTLGPATVPHIFGEALKILYKSGKSVGGVFVGDGVMLKTLKDNFSLPNVLFLGRMNPAQVRYIYRFFDFGFAGSPSSRLYRYGVNPIKIFDYFYYRLPVIFTSNVPERFNIVKISGAGISVEAENPAAVSEAILRLLSMPPSEREEMGEKGFGFLKSNHSYSVLAKKYTGLIEAIT